MLIKGARSKTQISQKIIAYRRHCCTLAGCTLGGCIRSRFIEKTIQFICQSGQTRTRQSCSNIRCFCSPESETQYHALMTRIPSLNMILIYMSLTLKIIFLSQFGQIIWFLSYFWMTKWFFSEVDILRIAWVWGEMCGRCSPRGSKMNTRGEKHS